MIPSLIIAFALVVALAVCVVVLARSVARLTERVRRLEIDAHHSRVLPPAFCSDLKVGDPAWLGGVKMRCTGMSFEKKQCTAMSFDRWPESPKGLHDL